MKSYKELPGLEDVVLEESYVLAVAATPGVVSFVLAVVLTPEHAEYVAPEDGTSLCYRDGILEFVGVTELEWTGQGDPTAVEVTGEQDYGFIDALTWDDRRYELEGGWGAMRITARAVRLILEGSAGAGADADRWRVG